MTGPRLKAGRALLCAFLSLGVVGAGGAGGMGPLERNHPDVARGMQAYEAGRFDEALSAFEAAQREKPDAPELELNRGDALYKLKRLEEARLAYERAASKGDVPLQEKSLFNLGNTLAALEKKSEAVAAYRKALLLDPKDAEVRRNLELLLKEGTPPPSPDGGSDGGEDAGPPPSPDGGPDAGSDGGSPPSSDGGSNDGGGPPQDAGDHGDGGQGDGGQGDGGSDGGQDGGDPNQDPQDEAVAPDAGSAKGERLSEDEAKRLLDSMKESEKSLQLWRFQKRKPRSPNEKDW